MLYITLQKHSLYIVYIKSTLLGKRQTSFIHKFTQEDLLDKKNVQSEQIKTLYNDALEKLNNGKKIKDRCILILPSSVFAYSQTELAHQLKGKQLQIHIKSYLEEKFENSADLLFHTEQYIHKNKTHISIYALEDSFYTSLNNTFNTMGLTIDEIYPSSEAYAALIERSVKLDTNEVILFATAQHNYLESFTYEGGIRKITPTDIYTPEYDLEKNLRETIQSLEKANSKPHRVIISGENSTSIRQDIFTKSIGSWVNLYKKIAPQFYDKELNDINSNDNSAFPYLMYDASFGAYILYKQDKEMPFEKLTKQTVFNKEKLLPAKKTLDDVKEEKTIDNTVKLAESGHTVNHRNEEYKTSKSKKNFISFLPMIGMFLGVGLIVFGITFALLPFFEGSNFPNITNLFEPSPTPTPMPSPTPLPPTPTLIQIDKKSVSVSILNGSGIKGKAQKISNIMLKNGYEKITTGNADNFNYGTSTIYIKSAIISLSASLVGELQSLGTFNVIEDSTKKTDITILFGSNIQ